MLINIALVGIAAVLAVVLFHRRVLKARLWRATVTPLASIIGSGFLISGPILAHSAGGLAPVVMLGLCAIAYLYGSAIRYTMVIQEDSDDPLTKRMVALATLSDFALSIAYFVSVAYYLNLFAAFGLRLVGVIDPQMTRLVSTVAIAAVGTIGLLGGLRALERLEILAVALKLAVIGAVIGGLAVAIGIGAAPSPLVPIRKVDVHEVQVVLGLIILVQGFETSRYLGAEYSAAERVRSMRWAQILATAVYVSFIGFAGGYFSGGLPESGAETAIIDMLAPLSVLVTPMLLAAALASQSSAAIADLNGAGGLLSEVTGKRVSVNLGNLATAGAAVAITWSADIFEIITYASKAFVAYYGLQALLASWLALRRREYGFAALYGAGVVLAVVVIVFAIPAEA